MATHLERRIKNLEKVIPRIRDGGFTASISPVDPPLGDDDPRLRRGVKEFEYVLPPGSIDPGRKEKRGRGFISPWCSVLFYDGGKRKDWNKALKELRLDDTFFDGHGVMSSLYFVGEGKLQPSGLLFMVFHAPTKPPNGSRWWQPRPKDPD